jgi:hypothetical protein
MSKRTYSSHAAHAQRTADDSAGVNARPALQHRADDTPLSCVGVFVGPELRLMLTNEAAQRLGRDIGGAVIANLRPEEWNK